MQAKYMEGDIKLLAKKKKLGRSHLTGWIMLLPALIYLLVWNVYPLVYALYVSFSNLNLTRINAAKFIGFTNYTVLLKDKTFYTAVGNTLLLTVSTIAIELIIGYFIAKLFTAADGVKGTGILRTLFMIPIMVTPLIIGLLWSYILNPTLGVMNYILDLLHLPTLAWFGDPKVALYSILGINVWQWAPFMMLLIIAGLNSIPKDLTEVAQIEGAGFWSRLKNIEAPFIWHVVVLGIFIRVMESLKMFDVVYVTTNGGPGTATELMSLMAYRQSFLYYQTGSGAAVAIIILIISTVIVQMLFKYLWKRDVV
ncbi:carbohydrate ABC transporter permease [Paenibacillus naphthalenovorans]|uniref:ABC transporter permease n=1 Tax=Paenibacillus naphthalenovorans TaxID=162209 RepID=A0A0U2W088_9BACL|nr:sugar ABC transporter permease [Paenibacillus naphthalenovorans]ALS25111.1 ABC transporter permease [Paenibacillus naphthalenovorans]GCL73219.1 sugar ABC transporter permease [Paenibacillus naphthalenovorans]